MEDVSKNMAADIEEGDFPPPPSRPSPRTCSDHG